MPIKYESWPIREHPGGQTTGCYKSGIKGIHYIGEYPTGIEASCEYHRSQFKNRVAVQEMIEWALAAANIKE